MKEKHNDDDKIIADFMGFKEFQGDAFSEMNYRLPDEYIEFLHCSHFGGLRFKHSWDWLMPVVEKIESLDLSDLFYSWEDSAEKTSHNFMNIAVNIERNSCYVIAELQLDPCMQLSSSSSSSGDAKTKIEATYKACLEFIKWYNLNK